MATRNPPVPPRSKSAAPKAAPMADPWIKLLALVVGGRPSAPDLDEAKRLLQAALETVDELAPTQLLRALDAGMARASGPAPPPSNAYALMLARLLHRVLLQAPFNAGAEQLKPLEQWLSQHSTDSLRPLMGPALRLVIGKPRDEDTPLLNEWLVQFIKETSMADITTFFIDVSSIPILQNDSVKNAYIARVTAELKDRFGVPADKADVTKVPSAAAVLGMTVLDGEVDPASSGLPDALRRSWLESIGDIPSLRAGDSGKVALSIVYQFIAETIPKLNGNVKALAVQEFAFVAREVIAGASSIPFGHPNFESAIRIALDRYVETRSSGDSLSLPPGSLPGGTTNAGGDADLNSDNIRVAGLTYSLALLEKTLVLRAADRLGELFMNGLLPFGHDAAGKALDEYYWDTEDRLSESQRRSQYSRMLGMPGGEVSKEVAPNKNFEQLFLRFIASISEYTRQREVDQMFTAQRSRLSMTGEQVRKCAFELAKNASLYAWGGSFYVATRINKHLDRALGLLNQPQVLKTYAASNHWQVVERIAQQDFGGAPNWVKYSTMAQSASTLFDILAKNTTALAATSSPRPFLSDLNSDGYSGVDGDLDRDTTRRLLIGVQSWLAVNGVRDEQVRQYAQPVEISTAPSLPALPTAGGDGLEVVNKLKQLTAGGTPSPEQLQQLLAQLH